MTTVRPAASLATSARLALWAFAATLLTAPFNAALATQLNTVINTTRSNIMPTFTLLQYLAYTLGAFLLVRGMLKLVAHIENPERQPLSHALLHFLGATFLMSLPAVVDMLFNTLALNGGGGFTEGAANPGLVVGAPPNSLDGMLIALTRNIAHPMELMMSALGAIIGLFLIVSALLRLARNGGQEGPRNSFGSGTMMRLIVGSALLSFAASADVFSRTLFGNNIVQFQGLSPTLGLGSTARFDAAIAAGLYFFQIIGFIAFMRGMLMLKAIADGNNGLSTAAAFTHIFGGAAAFNISPMLDVIQNTLGVTPVAIFS